jgi:DNA-binding NarL/FixJ family response regulator
MLKTTILIADDHQLFLDGIVSLLQTEKTFNIADTANDGYRVLELFGKNKYDVCILDINMPLLNGIDTAKKIVEKKFATKIIILTTHDDKEFISEMLHAGVSGYVLKNTTKTELIKAIKDVAAGEKYFSNEVHKSVMENYLHAIKKEKTGSNDEIVLLTPREIEIVKLLAKENTNENIANALHISYRTVETHRKNIMQKTGTKNLAGLIKYAYEKGILK